MPIKQSNTHTRRRQYLFVVFFTYSVDSLQWPCYLFCMKSRKIVWGACTEARDARQDGEINPPPRSEGRVADGRTEAHGLAPPNIFLRPAPRAIQQRGSIPKATGRLCVAGGRLGGMWRASLATTRAGGATCRGVEWNNHPPRATYSKGSR